MTRRLVLPDSLKVAPFSSVAAREAGVSQGRLRAADLRTPFHGVRIASDFPHRIQWLCRAYQERMLGANVFSHTTAARLYGLPLPLYVMIAESRDSADDSSGRDIAMADLSWREFRVLVEYEGDLHRKSRSKFRSDITRGELYADGKWHGLRVTADDVFGDPNPFLARLARALEAGGWQKPKRGLRHIAGARP